MSALPDRFQGRTTKLVEEFQNIVKNQTHGSGNILVFIRLICLIILTMIIIAIGVGSIPLILSVGSAWIIAIPMAITSILVYLILSIFSAVFSWGMSDFIIDNGKSEEKTLIRVANQETGIIQAFKRLSMSDVPLPIRIVGVMAALTGILEIGVGFAIVPTTIPGSLSINGGTFYSDPLVPCKVGVDAGCPGLFQSRFRFKWMQGASDVLVNGMSQQLVAHWGDEVDGERIIMVATTDNDTSITYKLVQAEKETIPAFSLTTVCNKPANFPGSIGFHKLNIKPSTPLLRAVQEDSGLDGRWMAEVIDLEQDNLNETTRITVNLVQVLAHNSSCKGNVSIAENFQLCYPTKGIQVVCLMNTHIEYVNFITAGCETCETKGITNNDRVEYSSPKPVYGEFIHESVASYGGHILIPQCADESVGGCTHNENSVDQVRENFVELLRGITASGILARRSLLLGKGVESPVQMLVKGTTGVKLEVGKGYWITILVMCILCFIGFVSWQFIKHPDFRYEHHQITSRWLLRAGPRWMAEASTLGGSNLFIEAISQG